ncbi:hypothetical protein GCM10010124_13750 [Pilimelia terevasa]|uniref:Colicin import membrane protein n=1 Tax=Pilimelia terevasa TaxID=53372 RepID=A0A8J3BRH2_9ACTN|nr:hypothetical protein [Pilimelia terevasa]GGK22477.1 hypothetical protein GCM10010124_13750 [Pilimelia terevasa]
MKLPFSRIMRGKRRVISAAVVAGVLGVSGVATVQFANASVNKAGSNILSLNGQDFDVSNCADVRLNDGAVACDGRVLAPQDANAEELARAAAEALSDSCDIFIAAVQDAFDDQLNVDENRRDQDRQAQDREAQNREAQNREAQNREVQNRQNQDRQNQDRRGDDNNKVQNGNSKEYRVDAARNARAQKAARNDVKAAAEAEWAKAKAEAERKNNDARNKNQADKVDEARNADQNDRNANDRNADRNANDRNANDRNANDRNNDAQAIADAEQVLVNACVALAQAKAGDFDDNADDRNKAGNDAGDEKKAAIKRNAGNNHGADNARAWKAMHQ